MATKTATMIYIGIVLIAMTLLGLNPSIGGVGIVTIGLILIGLEIFGLLKKIPVLNALSGKAPKSHLVIVFVLVLVFGGYLTAVTIKGMAPSVPNQLSTTPLTGVVQPTATANAQGVNKGPTYTAELDFYPSAPAGGTFTGSGVIYLLDPSLNLDRYGFMKIEADGNTQLLLAPGLAAPASSISVSGGKFAKTQLTGHIGDNILMCGYQDTTPAAAENISFCKTLTLASFNANLGTWGWTFSDGGTDFSWKNYATTAWYDPTDTARTGYKEVQTQALEKHLKVYTFATNNGEMIKDAGLYLEAPLSNAGAIEDVTITGPSGNPITYSSLQNTGNMASNNPAFIAAPSLTTGTDTMYYIGQFPVDALRSTTTDKGTTTIDIRYNHPASGDVLMYLKGVQNVNAKTVSGGHFDWGTTLTINMTTTGTTAWS